MPAPYPLLFDFSDSDWHFGPTLPSRSQTSTRSQVDASPLGFGQSLDGGALPAALTSIASATLTLPDVCPGLDSWSVMVHADGYFLTGGSTAGANSSATIALGVAPTVFTTGTIVNQNFNQGVQWRESYATSFIFTVDSGAQTFYELGSTNHPAGVSAANNNLIAQSVSVSC